MATVAYPVTAPPTAWADDDGRTDRAVLDLAAELDEMRQENEALTMRLAKANQLLKGIGRMDAKVCRSEGFDDSAAANELVAYIRTLAEIKGRIRLYLASAPEARS